MNLAGWLPTDTVIGFAGLVWMGTLLAALQSYGLYRLLIAGGTLWLLANALRGRGGLLETGLHLGVALTLLTFFGGQGVPLDKPGVSFAEAQRATATPGTTDPLTAGPTGAAAPRGFLAVAGVLQNTVNAAMQAVNADFVTKPFALLAATNSLMLGGFDEDPALRARLADFLDQCYGPAVTRWTEQHPDATAQDARTIDTPLSDQLEPLYRTIDFTLTSASPGGEATVKCAEVWGPLKGDLFTYADRQGSSTWMSWLGTKVSQWSSLSSDAWLRNALRAFRTSHQFASGFNAAETKQGVSEPGFALGSGLLAPLTYLFNWAMAAQLVEMVRYAASPALGYATAVLYVAYPFVLAAALLPGGVGRLVTYFALLGSVKGWPLVWAMVDQVYTRVLPSFSGVVTTPGGALDFYKPPIALNVVTGLMYILGPLMFSAALGMAGQAFGQGLSRFTTARLPFSLLRG